MAQRQAVSGQIYLVSQLRYPGGEEAGLDLDEEVSAVPATDQELAVADSRLISEQGAHSDLFVKG